MTNKIFPGPTWTSSHVYGEGSMNLQKKFCYFHIPKCASMWMRQYLSNMGQYHTDGDWIECNFTRDNIDDFTKIIILRDPVKRWISALPGRDFVVNQFNNTDALDRIFGHLESWLHDEHSARQTSFIAGLDLSNTVFFWCDRNLSDNVEDFFRKQGFKNTQPPLPINEQEPSELNIDATEKWQRILSMIKYLNIFRQTFADDYKLIESIKFYNKNDQ